MSYAEQLAPLLDDIRAPFALVLGPLERLRTDAIPEQIPAIELLQHNARQALDHLDDLSELTNLHTGKQAPSPQVFDYAPLIHGIIAALSGTAESRNLKFSVIEGAAQMPVLADSAHLEKGLVSLLLAVIRNTPNGGRIQVQASPGGLQIRHTRVGDLNAATTAVAGSYQPNQWGVYDMMGNVREWCLDYAAADLGSADTTDPEGQSAGGAQALRGGSWLTGAVSCRSAARYGAAPDQRMIDTGFRAVLLPAKD